MSDVVLPCPRCGHDHPIEAGSEAQRCARSGRPYRVERVTVRALRRQRDKAAGVAHHKLRVHTDDGEALVAFDAPLDLEVEAMKGDEVWLVWVGDTLRGVHNTTIDRAHVLGVDGGISGWWVILAAAGLGGLAWYAWG